MTSPRPDPAGESDHIARARESENFPVASRLLAAPLRPHVHAFYRVVRGADDVADSPVLARAEKEIRLAAIDAALAGHAAEPAVGVVADAVAFRALCVRHAYDVEPARHVLQAFRADAANRPCREWSDLLAYCRYSAVPVGRFLLDIHGERDAAAVRASDALCTALQILNHLQDCKQDWTTLGRCYLPTNWLAREGVEPTALADGAASPALRRVIDRTLDHLEPLLREADTLARRLADPRLAREAAGIAALAQALARRLRREDPLRQRVALGRPVKAAVFLWAALRAPRRPRVAGGSSFRRAMRLFARDARDAVAAVHALARRLDDIADGDAPAERKSAAFAAWRAEIDALYRGAPTDPLAVALRPWCARLPASAFHELIDGLESDVVAPAHAPDETSFRLYCRRVAGTIGVLVLASCGRTAPDDERYALALGEALQRVNVLRDIAADAQAGRLYLPREILIAAGIDPARPIPEILDDPRLAAARAAFIATIDAAFVQAERLADAAVPRYPLGVAAIAAIYRRLFARLRDNDGGAVRLGRRDHAIALLAALRRR